MKEIETLIPHRNPFLYIDEIISLSKDEIVGQSVFSDTNTFLKGSFCGTDFVPGVILIEAMAQCGGAGIKKLGLADGLFGLANIENASYPLACCAERTAVFAAINAGHMAITAVAVTAPKVVTVTPCGACRQVLNEFKPADTEMAVILDGLELSILTLTELLPRAFGPQDLA